MLAGQKANFQAPNPAILAETAFVFADAPKQVGLTYKRVWQLAAYGQISRCNGDLHQLEWCWIRSARGTSVEAFYRLKLLLAGVSLESVDRVLKEASAMSGPLKQRLKRFA